MKWILALLLFVSAAASAQIGLRDDSTKYIHYKYQYGSRMPRLWADSALHMPYYDTTIVKPQKPGAIMMHTDKVVYKWNGNGWEALGASPDSLIFATVYSVDTAKVNLRDEIGAGHDLQQVTDRGSKTTDTIISEALRTKLIIGDTLDQDDFEIDVFPDLQGYSGIPRIEPMDSMFNWIVTNRTTENIKAVLQVGDLTNVEGFDAHFVRVDTQFDKLDVYNIPHLPVIGNHDYAAPYLRDASTYNNYFGPARYTGKSYYGGCLNGSHENFFILFEASGHKYAAIGLEFLARDSALDWAQNIIDSLPDREIILVTHAFLGRSGERGTDTTQHGNISDYSMAEGNTPEQMWQKLVRRNNRIFLVVSGHFINGSGTTPPVVKRITDAGLNGNTVYQIVCNYQQDTLSGNGYFMRMKFKPRENKIAVSFYSPYLGYNDARFASYELNYPAIRIEGAVGVNRGGLNVAGETRLDSAVKISGLPLNYIVKNDADNNIARSQIKDDGTKLTVTSLKSTGTAPTTTGATKIVVADTLGVLSIRDSADAIGNAFVKNQTAAAQTAGFYINTPSIISTTGSYRSQLVGNLPADFYIARANSSFNSHLSLQQAGATAPRMAFYHTTSGDFNIRTPSPNGDQLGVVGWHGNRKSDSAITDLMNITAFVRNGVTHTGAEFVLELRDTATGNRTDRFHVTSMGDVRIGGTSTTSYRLHVQSGDAYFAGNSYTIGSKGIGTTSPTARLHLPAGTASANTAPLKLTAGTNLTTPEAGAVEFDGTNYFATTGSTRYKLSRTLEGSTTHDFGTIANNSSATTTVSVTGAADGDFVVVTKPVANGWSNGESYTAWVSAADQVTVRQNNNSGGSAGFGSQTINVKVIKQ